MISCDLDNFLQTKCMGLQWKRKIFDPKKIGSNKFWMQIEFGPKFWVKKNFGLKKFLLEKWVKKIQLS